MLGRHDTWLCTVQIATEGRITHSDPPTYEKQCPITQTTAQASKALTPALLKLLSLCPAEDHVGNQLCLFTVLEYFCGD